MKLVIYTNKKEMSQGVEAVKAVSHKLSVSQYVLKDASQFLSSVFVVKFIFISRCILFV